MRTPALWGCGVVLALSSASCGTPASPVGETAQAITAGVADDTDTAAVLIVAKVGRSTGFCSGVVVSPHVVLTAAHCAVEEAEYSIFLGADYNDAAARALSDNFVAVTEHHAHPKHSFSSNTNDIGVLITSTALPRTPVPLNRKPLAMADVGAAIRIVGFGQTTGGSKVMGRRMEGKTTIATLDATSLTVKALPNICLFDSGGPTFMMQDGVDVVAGIHFIIDSAECNSEGVDVRVDAYTEFVDGYVSAADPPTPADADAGAPASPVVSEAPASGCSLTGGARQSSPWIGLYALLATVMLRSRRRSRASQEA